MAAKSGEMHPRSSDLVSVFKADCKVELKTRDLKIRTDVLFVVAFGCFGD